MSSPRPFFATDNVDRARRRALLISAAFPPLHYVGSLRWRSFAKVGAERGWKFDVVMEDPAIDHAIDMDLLNDAPPGLRLFPYRLPESHEARLLHSAWKALRGFGEVIGNSGGRGRAAGDAVPVNTGAERTRSSSLLLVRREVADFLEYRRFRKNTDAAFKLARAVVRAERPQIVISSGPPHYAHVAAARVARDIGAPLALDLRDPWVEDTTDAPVRGRAWLRTMRRAERYCVETASLVVLNTDEARMLYTERYPEVTAKFVTVMNGADPDIGAPSTRGKRFVIAYVGGRYGLRSPANLFAAARRVIDELRVKPDELSIEFMGPEDDLGPTSKDLAEQSGIGEYFRSLGKQPRRESLALQARASVLVLLPQAQYWAIPAKVFEHVQFDAWILALMQPTSAVASLLSGSSAAVINPQDVSAISTQLKKWLLAYRAGDFPVRLNTSGRFDRARQAAKLFDAIDIEVGRRKNSDQPEPTAIAGLPGDNS